MDEEIGVDVVIDDEQESIATETSIDAIKGDKGDKGDTGDRGPAGPQGERGIQGERGPAGPTGPQGETGPVGPAGEQGPVGPIGPTGPQGEIGPAGPQGIQGIQGEKGDKGDTGEQGIQGEKGDKGDKGDTGAKGDKGDKGDTGDKGDKGDTGPQGSQGPQGIQGPAGNDGVSPTITTSKTGKVTTITITDAQGTSTATILDGEDGQGAGDMLKSVYDTDNDGVVDNAEKVNNHTVASDVPADAVFTDTTYTAGTGISISEQNVISNTQTNAEWGNITGTLSNQTDLNTALGGKADASSLSAVATSGSYADLSNKPTIPTKVSDLTNDSGFITGMTILNYGTSTWQDFLDAYNANKVVYTKVSGRLAFMAYVSLSGSTPTSVEFQYYRSMSSPSYSAQADEVYIYKLTNSGAWTTTTRQASTKTTITADTGIEYTYTANGRVLELKGIQRATMPTASSSNEGKIYQFVGTTTSNYTQGYFYKCVNNSGTYSWQQINVQPTGSSGGSSIVDDEGDPVATMTLHNDPDDTDSAGTYSCNYLANYFKNDVIAEIWNSFSPEMHNNMLGGGDITAYYYSGELSQDLAQGRINVWIGDYIMGQATMTKYIVADINYYLRTGTQEEITPHLVLVPENILGKTPMMQNPQGGKPYTQTYLYTQGLSDYEFNIGQDFFLDVDMQDHLLSVEKILPAGASGGATMNTTTATRSIDIMSEVQVFGARFYADDTNGMNRADHQSYDNRQLALFRLNPQAIFTPTRESYWLRDCIDQQSVALIVDGKGTVSYKENNNQNIGVRPTIVVW